MSLIRICNPRHPKRAKARVFQRAIECSVKKKVSTTQAKLTLQYVSDGFNFSSPPSSAVASTSYKHWATHLDCTCSLIRSISTVQHCRPRPIVPPIRHVAFEFRATDAPYHGAGLARFRTIFARMHMATIDANRQPHTPVSHAADVVQIGDQANAVDNCLE